MDTSRTTRQKNLKALVAQWGGATSLAKKLGYSNASYISQMVTGHRPITERNARKIEQELQLSAGWLDREHHAPTARAPAAVEVDTSLFSRIVVITSAAVEERGARLSVSKFSDIVAFLYERAQGGEKIDATTVQRLLDLVL